MKFQNGGFIPQVYNTQQVNPVFLNGDMGQMINAAGMPLESGLNGYMGLQQLDIQRGQEERAKEEFKYKIKAYDRAELDNVLKQMNTLRDDFSKIEILPQDGEKYNQILNQYVTEDVKRRAASGDINAMKEYYMGYNSFVMHPEVRGMMMNKQRNDKNIEMFTKYKDQLEYVDNADEIIQQQFEGKPISAPKFNSEKFKADIEQKRLLDSSLNSAKTLEINNRAAQLQEEIDNRKIQKAAINTLAAKELGLTTPYEQLNPEDKLKVEAKSWEIKNADLLVKYKTSGSAIEKANILAQIENSRAERFNELVNDYGLPADMAYEKVYGTTTSNKDSDYETFRKAVKAENPNMSEVEIRSAYTSKNSTVTHNSNKITDKDNNVTHVIVNGKKLPTDKLPTGVSYNEIGETIDIKGGGWFTGGQEGRKFIKDAYGIDVENIQDAATRIPGAKWNSDTQTLEIPINNNDSPQQPSSASPSPAPRVGGVPGAPKPEPIPTSEL